MDHYKKQQVKQEQLTLVAVVEEVLEDLLQDQVLAVQV